MLVKNERISISLSMVRMAKKRMNLKQKMWVFLIFDIWFMKLDGTYFMFVCTRACVRACVCFCEGVEYDWYCDGVCRQTGGATTSSESSCAVLWHMFDVYWCLFSWQASEKASNKPQLEYDVANCNNFLFHWSKIFTFLLLYCPISHCCKLCTSRELDQRRCCHLVEIQR